VLFVLYIEIETKEETKTNTSSE